MTKQQQSIGRLAMRQEGASWNAYYAFSQGMEDAVFLGSICMRAVAGNEDRQKAFMDMMRDVVADVVEDATGVRPSWRSPVAAPEHERGGNC